jgi:hypothetical protein
MRLVAAGSTTPAPSALVHPPGAWGGKGVALSSATRILLPVLHVPKLRIVLMKKKTGLFARPTALFLTSLPCAEPQYDPRRDRYQAVQVDKAYTALAERWQARL